MNRLAQVYNYVQLNVQVVIKGDYVVHQLAMIELPRPLPMSKRGMGQF